MQLHHSKHHATYVNNLNVAEEKMKEAVAKGDVNTQISLGPALKFNGGGHLNHSIFWANLSPSGGKPNGIFKQFYYTAVIKSDKSATKFSFLRYNIIFTEQLINIIYILINSLKFFL